MALDFQKPIAVLTVYADGMVATLDSRPFEAFYPNADAIHIPARQYRDRMAGVADGLKTADLTREKVFSDADRLGGVSDMHVEKMTRWVEAASVQGEMADRARVPAARDFRSKVQLGVFRDLGSARKALHVDRLLVHVRAADPALGAFGIDTVFADETAATLTELDPVIEAVKAKEEEQKAWTRQLEALRDELRLVTHLLIGARETVQLRRGVHLPDFDLSKVRGSSAGGAPS